MLFLQADEDPNLVPQMGDSSTFSFNPQGPPGADGGAGHAVGGANEAAASAGDAALGDAAPFQFWNHYELDWFELVIIKKFFKVKLCRSIKIPRNFKIKEQFLQILTTKKGVIISKLHMI